MNALETARQRGFLDQRRRNSEPHRQAYERWCWSLKIPVVRILRQSPRSRFSVVLLDMYTTPNTLSAEGEQAAVELCQRIQPRPERSVSPFGGEFRKIPHARAPKFAREIFRIATSLGYYLPDMALADARRRACGERRRTAAVA